jgi:CBS domain-containing protein
VLAQLIASRINPDSIYTTKLRRLGGMGGPRKEPETLDLLLVADAMSEEIPWVSATLPLTELADRAREEHHRSWIVFDDEQGLRGIVAVTDLERAIVDGDLGSRTVEDVMTTALVTCEPGETLRHAFRRFSERDVFQIPVVDPERPGEIQGVLRRTEMMWAFRELSEEHQRLLERTGALPRERSLESVQMELQVTPEYRHICNHALRDIRVPEHALIALLRRGDRVVVPRGFTKVEPGDELTLITTRAHEASLRDWIAEGRQAV